MENPIQFFILPGLRVRVVWKDGRSEIMTLDEVKSRFPEMMQEA